MIEDTQSLTGVIYDEALNGVVAMNERYIPDEIVTEDEFKKYMSEHETKITEQLNQQTADVNTQLENQNREFDERLEEYSENYLDIITPKNTASGQLVQIKDALGLHTFGTKSPGQVRQETTSGKQLFNYKDITHQVAKEFITDDEGWITLSCDNSAGTEAKFFNYFTNNLALENSKNYNVLVEVKNVTGEGRLSISNTHKDSQFNYEYFLEFIELKNGSVLSKIIPTKDSFEGTLYGLRTYLSFAIGRSGSITFRLSLIEDTTVTPETFVYEPYTGGQASPNPEFPQEIEVLEGYQLFDKNNANILYDTYIGTAGNVGSALTNNILYLEIKPNTSYTIQKISSNRFRVGTYNSLDVVGKTLNNIITNLNDSITSYTLKNTTDKYLFFQYLGGDKNEQEILDSIIINEGIDKKTYLPCGCIGYKGCRKNLLSQNNAEFTLFKKLEINPIGPGTYKISGKIISTDTDADKCLLSFRKADVEIKGLYVLRGNFSETLILPGEIDSVNLYASSGYNVSVGDTATYTDLMISKDGGEYEPYQEKIVPLDLKGNWVGKINDDIKDYLLTDKKKYWLVKNVGKVVFNGNEEWNTWGVNYSTEGITGFYSMDFNDYNQSLIKYIKSTHFEVNVNAWGGAEIGINASASSNPYIIMTIPNDALNDISSNAKAVESFKTWLSNNPVEVLYPTKETEIIELGKLPEPIKTFEGTNNIQVLANLDTEIEVKYALDIKKYVDNNDAEISSQIL